MAELRTDWLTGRAVIVAENRALRPNEFAPELRASPLVSAEAAAATGAPSVANLALAEVGLPEVAGVPSCPFCAGNESRTPPAVYEQLDQEGNWNIRVVPNMFPAVMLDDEATGGSTVGSAGRSFREQHPFAERKNRTSAASEPPASTAAIGAHEVIVESARHIDRTSALSAAEMFNVLGAYAERLRHWRADERLAYGLVFKNQGPRAGASIAHLHSQLIALPAVPPAVAAEMSRAAEAYGRQRTCPYCLLIEQERSSGARVVLDESGYVAFCPFASLQPHEVWLLPQAHEPSFEEVARPAELKRLAGVLHALIGRLESVVPDAAYNMLLRTAPWRANCDNWCHWRIELLPRVNAFAGLELATGLTINPLAPERAAPQLRPI